MEFLSKYIEVIVLKSEDGLARVAVAPAYQGRVMTSTAAGPDGQSFGRINRELITSCRIVPHIDVSSGEDRSGWVRKTGSLLSFIPEDAPFHLEHRHTPACMGTEAYELVVRNREEAVFPPTVTVSN